MSLQRRDFLASAAAAATAAVLPVEAREPSTQAQIVGTTHWTVKKTGAADVKLFLWRKQAAGAPANRKTLLFVHGSSVSATPVFLTYASAFWAM